MFFHADIKGDLLPPKTLCLTYDDGPGSTDGDGPGPRTAEIGEFLAAEGVAATFFAIGRHAEAHRGILAGLVARGHLVGNHTYSHPGLVGCVTSGADVVDEVARTDAILRAAAPADVVFLRAPYGNWRETVEPDGGGGDRPTSIVADRLNASGAFPGYVGPINWDISNEDWSYWQRGLPAEECAASCLDRVESIGRGIILLHDSSEEDEARGRNRTLEVTRRVVPALLARGYAFVRLDAVPQVASALRVTSLIALVAPDGRHLSSRGGGITTDGPAIGFAEHFGVVRLPSARVALRAVDGRFLSAPPGGEVRADAPTIGDREALELEVLGADRVAFRTSDGRYVTCAGDGGIGVGAIRRGRAAVFEVRRLSPDFGPVSMGR